MSVQHHLSISMCIRTELGQAVTPEVPLQITGEMLALEVVNDAFWRGYKPFVICLLSKSPDVSEEGFIASKAAERLWRGEIWLWKLEGPKSFLCVYKTVTFYSTWVRDRRSLLQSHHELALSRTLKYILMQQVGKFLMVYNDRITVWISQRKQHNDLVTFTVRRATSKNKTNKKFKFFLDALDHSFPVNGSTILQQRHFIPRTHLGMRDCCRNHKDSEAHTEHHFYTHFSLQNYRWVVISTPIWCHTEEQDFPLDLVPLKISSTNETGCTGLISLTHLVDVPGMGRPVSIKTHQQ